MEINNIRFTIEAGSIDFNFDVNGQDGSASLQLPSTADSSHTINNEDYNSDDKRQLEIYEALTDFYFDSFDDVDLAAASALLGDRVARLVQVRGLYVAFCSDDSATLIKESPYRSYYNKKSLFGYVDICDLQVSEDEVWDEYDLIEEARSN